MSGIAWFKLAVIGSNLFASFCNAGYMYCVVVLWGGTWQATECPGERERERERQRERERETERERESVGACELRVWVIQG